MATTKIITVAIGLVLLFWLPATASATVITGIIESDGTRTTRDHTVFSVNTAGVIDIYLESSDDPAMILRSASDSGALGAYIAYDDDSGRFLDAAFSLYLAVGWYTIINGEFLLDNGETGFVAANPGAPSAPYTLSISGDTSLRFRREGNLDGTFILTSVPEPTGFAMLALALLCLLPVRRKRRCQTGLLRDTCVAIGIAPAIPTTSCGT